jgi:fumarate reductase flavoprotein subunit
MDPELNGPSRREFLNGAAAAAVALAGGGILAGTAVAPPAVEAATGAASTAADETIEVEVVVVGSGLGGLAAAMTAAEEGAKKVVLLEKEDYWGGATNWAEGNGRGQSTEAEARKSAISRVKSSGYMANPMLYYYMALDRKEDTDWLFDKHQVKTESMSMGGGAPGGGQGQATSGEGPADGSQGQMPSGGQGQAPGGGGRPGGGGGPSFYAGGNGRSCIATLIPQAKALGIDLRMKTPAVSLLLKDPTTCTGVRARTAEGKTIEFKAKAVVLATGGMSTNKALLAKYSTIDMEKVLIDGPASGQDGDGHVMVEASAHGKAMHLCVSSLFINVKGFAYASSMGVCAGMQPTNLWVNQDAVRFTDESIVSSTEGCNKMVEIQGSVYSIMDQAGFDKYAAGGCQSHYSGFADKLVGKPIPGLAADFEKYKNLPDVFTAQTVEELAKKMGIDAAALKETVKKYNGFAKAGTDEEWGKKTSNIWPIEKAPFYGFRLSSGMLNTNGGVRINTNAQVVDPRYRAITGLYAAGIVTSGWMGETYLGGGCQPVALWCGRKAAKHIVANLL